MIEVNIKLENEESVLPSYKTAGSNAADCFSTIEEIIPPGEKVMIPLGFSIELPEGYCALLIPRSGLATKQRLTLANSVGLIDSDYRGECKACIVNESNEPRTIKKGDRVCQMLILESPKIEFTVKSELSNTERGSGGFGSTGVN